MQGLDSEGLDSCLLLLESCAALYPVLSCTLSLGIVGL